MRELCRGWDVAALCIDHRIKSFRSFDWSIVPAEGAAGDTGPAVIEARRIMAKPDGRTPYKSWISKALGDLFRYDAPVFYRRRNLIGQVIGLDVVSGTSISPMIDYYGRLPEAPAPAFIQYANGVPWDSLSVDDLIYEPFNPQSDSPIGRAPIEDVILLANTDIRMAMHLMDYWDEGNIPAGIFEAQGEIGSVDPAKIIEAQDVWDATNQSDQQRKVQVRFGMPGFKFNPVHKDSFDENAYLWCVRKGAAAFGVVPQDLGLTMDVNRANGETQMDVQERVSDRPLADHIDGIITRYLQDDRGLPVEFQTSYSAEKEDRLAEAQVWSIAIDKAAASPDDMRAKMFGLPVNNEAPVPRSYMTARGGPIPLHAIYSIAGPIDPETGGPTFKAPLLNLAVEGAAGVLPGKTMNTPGALVSSFDPDEPQFPQNELATPPAPTLIAKPGAPAPVAKELTPGITTATGIEGVDLQGHDRVTEDDDEDDEQDDDEDAQEVAKELRRWRDNARSRVRNGRKTREFASTVIPHETAAAVWKSLALAANREQVDAAFAVRKATSPFLARDALLDQIAAHYGPLIAKALRDALPGDLASIIGGYVPRVAKAQAIPADRAAARDYLAGKVSLDTSNLQDTLSSLSTDAYLGGVAMAAGASNGVMPESMAGADWNSWTPGWAGAAAKISDPGLSAALSGIGLTIKGIADSTIDQMGTQIADGVASGASMDTIARGLRDSVGGDASRAYMIADTEATRAVQSASLDTYNANGVEMLDWLDSADACDDCVDLASGSPYAIDDFPDLPEHPRCRCSSSPSTSPTDDTAPVDEEG